MKIINLLLISGIGIFTFATCGCSETKEEIVQSGDLKFVKTLKYGSAGTHGGHGWYVSDRNFYFNTRRWRPAGIDVNEDIANCEASPNKEVEVLKCDSFANMTETAYVLSVKDEKPAFEKVSESQSDGGHNFGEWTNDGKRLLFLDKIFNIETAETLKVRGLPDYPENYFRGTSPDSEIIVYQGDCFNGGNLSEEVERRRKQTCDNHEDYLKKKVEVLWIIETKTGETKLLELSREKYDWLIWNKEKFDTKTEWINFFRQQLLWEKDKNGKYQLIVPK